MSSEDLVHYSSPPLRPWESALRYLVAVLPMLMTLLVWGLMAVQPLGADDEFTRWARNPAFVVVDVALGVAGLVLMRWRRRHPVLIAIVVTVFGLASFSASGPATVCLVSVATRRRAGEIVLVGLSSVVVTLVASSWPFFGLLWEPQPPGIGAVVMTVLMVTGLVLVGLYVGARRALIASLRERAEVAEREQTLRVQQARTTERTRIAREMHDVMAHRVSLVSMHAGALAYREDLSPEETRAAAAVIQQNAHQALTELRAVLGALRADDAAEPPQPTLAGLPALIADAEQAGQRIELRCTAALEEIPERISRDAYRVVQEGLTNARKHAPGSKVTVQLETPHEAGVLLVTVSNPAGLARSSGPGARLGLIGLRERVELAGGRLEHRLEPSGMFELEARLPW